MLRTGFVSLMMLGVLSACGHTPEERAVSGALIGATAGAIVGLASQPEHGDYYDDDRYDDRYYERPRRHHHKRRGGWRRHRDYDRWDYYD